jgi:hypothetical protein
VTLPPLHWLAHEDLVYNREANELHRPSCPRAAGEKLGERNDL